MITRALISVSDKTGIIEFSQKLKAKGVEILSTGGTAKLLRENGIDVQDVSNYTGFPEMMNGRVKTLHPKVHGGLLALRDNPEHMQAAQENGIEMIDLVVVNLYPFQEAIAKTEVTLEDAIENIDIGGPSMLRSAAKNYQSVTVLTDPSDYELVLSEIENKSETTLETRAYLAQKVFAKTATYDAAIAHYLNADFLSLNFSKKQDLRYGENPHQKATFYQELNNSFTSFANAKQHQGKELSFNNIFDGDGALDLIQEFERPAVTIIKHANPCGTAQADTVEEAYDKALSGDPISAFGGIIAMNRECSQEVATKIVEHFFEIVIAPTFSDAALEVFKAKPNLRILETGEFKRNPNLQTMKKVIGGILVQDADLKEITKTDLTVVTQIKPTESEIETMLFAWKVVKHVKSNAIVLAKNEMTVGVGAGQMSRVDSTDIAVKKAGDRVLGSVLASDAFFPFPDAIELAHAAGIKTIIQPGGSIKDKDVIAKADELGIAMVFTGSRCFLH